MNAFDRALEVLDTHGWTQFRGTFYDTRYNGGVCLGLALGNAKCTRSDCFLIGDVIEEHYPRRLRRVDRYPNFPFFNDHPETTEEDVRLVLKLASAKAGESV